MKFDDGRMTLGDVCKEVGSQRVRLRVREVQRKEEEKEKEKEKETDSMDVDGTDSQSGVVDMDIEENIRGAQLTSNSTANNRLYE